MNIISHFDFVEIVIGCETSEKFYGFVPPVYKSGSLLIASSAQHFDHPVKVFQRRVFNHNLSLALVIANLYP